MPRPGTSREAPSGSAELLRSHPEVPPPGSEPRVVVRGHPDVGEGEREVVLAGLDVAVGLSPRLLVFFELLGVGGHVLGEELNHLVAPRQDELRTAAREASRASVRYEQRAAWNASRQR